MRCGARGGLAPHEHAAVVSTKYLLDNSAWTRIWHRALPLARREEVATAITERRVHACLPFLLEAGYSARGADDHDQIMLGLRSLPFAAIDEATEERALQLQADLAQCGHHRMPPVDLLIAAIAERHGLTVLHCDRDFDVIRDRTSARMSSEWLAPPTSFS